jgi:hypothetical protein
MILEPHSTVQQQSRDRQEAAAASAANAREQ